MRYVFVDAEIRTNHFNFRFGTEYTENELPEEDRRADNQPMHHYAIWVLTNVCGYHVMVPVMTIRRK